MIASVPARAPVSPPDTGASRDATPRCAACSCSRLASAGSDVVMSITMLPLAVPARTPPDPRYTSSTSRG